MKLQVPVTKMVEVVNPTNHLLAEENLQLRNKLKELQISPHLQDTVLENASLKN